MSRKILPLEFFDYSQLPKKEGLKFAMFRLEKDGKLMGFEWGFTNFVGGIFEDISTEGVNAKVVKWAEQPNPQLLF